MEIYDAVKQALEGCTKDVEVAVNARRIVNRPLTAGDVEREPILMSGALEILIFQVGNGRCATRFMLSVLDFYRRRGSISPLQAATVINAFVEANALAPAPAPGAAHVERAFGIYKCTIRRCREYNKEFDAMLPSERRQATGRALQCSSCGDVVVLVRVVDRADRVLA